MNLYLYIHFFFLGCMLCVGMYVMCCCVDYLYCLSV